MSAYLGDFRIGSVVRKMWNTNAIAGESITRATNGTVQVYKDGGTSQSTAGVTDTEDFDSLTGVHLAAIDTSADGTFYSAGSEFEVVLAGATIDGKSINATLFSFSLENRSALMPTTAGRKLDVSVGGEAGVDLANVGSPTTTLNLSGTSVGVATALGTQAKADVNAEVLDVVNVDTFAEPGQENPPATTTLVKKVGYGYKLNRNRKTQTSSQLKVYADNGTTVDQKAAVSDDGTTFDMGELATGP